MKVAQGGFDLVKPIALHEKNLRLDAMPARWVKSPGLVGYHDAVSSMEAHAEAIRRMAEPELLWFLEHPPLYTAGTSARADDLLDAAGLPVYPAGRGGQFTYHGPGQRVVYVMLDLSRRGSDVRAFVRGLEAWLIDALAMLGVQGVCRPGRTGVWAPRPDKGEGREDKIAAIGVRVRRWVSFHGVSINVDPDLAHYNGIVPCGIADQGITSLADLGRPARMAELDGALLAAFPRHFGPLEAGGIEPSSRPAATG